MHTEGRFVGDGCQVEESLGEVSSHPCVDVSPTRQITSTAARQHNPHRIKENTLDYFPTQPGIRYSVEAKVTSRCSVQRFDVEVYEDINGGSWGDFSPLFARRLDQNESD
ncbi:hypothetical protein AB1N83_004212 [Pleurotus pulmonarius]